MLTADNQGMRFNQGVYFVRCLDYIKIGFTSDIKQRLTQYRCCCPFPVEMVAIIPCRSQEGKLEKDIQRQFKHLRAHGEWFYLGADLQRFIDTINQENLESCTI